MYPPRGPEADDLQRHADRASRRDGEVRGRLRQDVNAMSKWKTEAAMNRGRMFTRAIPLLIGIGLSLSGCAVRPVGYYDGFYYGGWGGWHHGWVLSHGACRPSRANIIRG